MEDFITNNKKYVSVRIFNSIYLILMILSLSSGTYSLIYGKDFASWGWIVFTIGCLMLMIMFMLIIIYFVSELIYTTEKKVKYNLNPIIMLKDNSTKTGKSKRFDLVIKN
jgi:hypothetical protein